MLAYPRVGFAAPSKPQSHAARACDKYHGAFANKPQTGSHCHATTATEWAPTKPKPEEVDNSAPMAPDAAAPVLIAIAISARGLIGWMLRGSWGLGFSVCCGRLIVAGAFGAAA